MSITSATFGPWIPLSSPSADRTPLRHLASVRWGLAVAALLLSLIGLATVHSATAELAVNVLPRQLLWIGIGIVVMLVAFSFDYHAVLDFSLVLYVLGLVALVLVLLFGERIGGARSWIGIGSFGGQPAELMKAAAALMLARYLATVERRHLSAVQVAAACGLIAVPVVLVALEPDYGSAAMFLPILAGMLLVGGIRWRAIAAAVPIALLLLVVLFFFGLQDYQRQRILTYASPNSDQLGAGYQVRQSKIAVGSGELLGRGYMQGTQSQLRFLPERHTDFVFAVLAEEWGFAGVLTVLGLYALYFANGAQVAMRARDRSGVLLVVGLLSLSAFHVLYNTAMVVGMVPITGIPLPFLSYGGSFTLVNFLSTGLILGVDLRRHVNR
jgi:rod shape determining protein RodA